MLATALAVKLQQMSVTIWRVTVIGAATVLALVLAFSTIRTKAQNSSRTSVPIPPEKAMSAYLGLRNQALHVKPDKMGLPATLEPTEPMAVLIDWPTSKVVATVSAFADGTASIYISNGGGFIGGGQGYESIRRAGQNMLATARFYRPLMHTTQDFPLPQEGEIFFYVVTNSGVFTARASEAACKNRTDPLTKLCVAGQNVIMQYRLISSPPQ